MAQAADVFVSYSSQDKDQVHALVGDLRSQGISVWVDQGGIDGAAIWGEEIVRAIENCKVLMLMISPASVESQNVLREVMLILEKKKQILPIHLQPVTIPASLKYPLAGIQHIEYFRGDAEENFKNILRSLQRVGIEPSPQLIVAGPGSSSEHHSMHSADVTLPPGALAVLPFDNISPDKETDYFADGLTEELITSLSSLSEVEVVSRIVSMQYKGTKKDLKTIGRELEARYIVVGSIRKLGENIRINAQLVDSGTNRQLWAQTYKGNLDDIFDIQEQVGQQIAESLKLKLSLTEKIGLTKRPTVNAQAYDLYLRGREYMYQLTKRSVEYSIQLFEKAYELDPRYAAAYAACSNAYGLLYGLFKRDEKLKEKAQELGLKALMYDSNSAESYAALSFSYYHRHMYEEAVSAGRKAIELDPDNFLAYWIVGRICYSMSNYEEAHELFEKSIGMQPDFYAVYSDLKLTCNAMGKPEEAARIVKVLLELLPSYLLRYPEDSRARMAFAINLAEVQKVDEAKREGQAALDQSIGDPLMLYNGACFFAQLGDIPRAVKALSDAIAAGHENFDWIKRDSDLDPIRSDPEYIELMKGR